MGGEHRIEEIINRDLMPMIHSQYYQEKKLALEWIDEMKDITPSEKARLIEPLTSDPDTSTWALELLQKYPCARTYAILHRKLLEGNETAIDIVAEMGVRRLSPALKHFLNSKNISTRRTAATALARFSEGKLVQLYGRLGEDQQFRRSKKNFIRAFGPMSGMHTLLGGKWTGKVMVRYINQYAFKAWKKAFEAGIPVEPILKRRNGQYRVSVQRVNSRLHMKSVRVFCGVIPGMTLQAFQLKPAYAKYKQEIDRQKKEIVKKLLDIGVVHGDLYNHNFLVEWDPKNGKVIPKIHVIDFGEANLSDNP